MLLLSQQLNKERLHHAYLIEGDSKEIHKQLLEFIANDLKIKVVGNPDLYIMQTDNITIDDAHELTMRSRQSAFLGGKKIFIILSRTIQHEAQHALLKTIEEPRGETHFFFIVENAGKLLPTIHSRVERIIFRKQEESELASQFIEGSIVERMKIVEKLVTKKDADGARKLLDGLLFIVENGGFSARDLEMLISARSYIEDRGASMKILLEHLAMTFEYGTSKSKS